MVLHTSVARVLQWGGGGGGENDITFHHTLYTGADPESFGGVDVILNQFKCTLNAKTFRPGNGRK